VSVWSFSHLLVFAEILLLAVISFNNLIFKFWSEIAFKKNVYSDRNTAWIWKPSESQ